MEQTIANFEMEENTKNDLKIPQRLNQHYKYEEYTIDGCSEDQKKVLSYILQYLKNWHDLPKTSDVLESFIPFRITLCGVVGSGKSTLINTLVTAIRKITGKQIVYMCVIPQDLQLLMLVEKHVIGYSAFLWVMTISFH